MKNTLARLTLALSLLACGATWLAPPSAAQEGPLRQFLRERKAQKQQQQQQHQQPSASAADNGQSLDAKLTQPGDHDFTIQHGGLERKYRVHVPARYDPAAPTPLIVSLHGGGAHMEYQATDANYGQISKSDREGFVVVFPNGFSKTGGRLATWNAGNCCGPARDQNVDDVGFIRQVVTNVSRQMNIDSKRVYATGMSNGALMAYRLACEASDVFKAIAPVAGTDNTRSCQPKNPVPVLHFHAKDDDHAVFTGGSGPKSMSRGTVTEFVSVPDSIAKWTRLDGCPATPRRVLEKPGAYCDAYGPCRDNTVVQLCVTETGGHSWPGAQRTRGAPASQAISANDLMWDFFSRL